MKIFIKAFFPVLILISISCNNPDSVTISGKMKQWHLVTFTFEGPMTSESDSINPFLDYRFDIFFRNGQKEYMVPGFYAADGNAAQTGSSMGNIWQAYFVPDSIGTWNYEVSFRKGKNMTIATNISDGDPVFSGQISGSFEVDPPGADLNDLRNRGMLRYAGNHYLEFTASREKFLKGGADSPENFLGYFEFDQTPPSHKYQPHAVNWHPGDPTWQDGKGKSIIGALNYLSSKGMNSVYMIVMNVAGDGKDVWPWTSKDERYRFDCSKLDQWEIVFNHMDSLGIMLHILLSEAENSSLFEMDEFGRKGVGFASSRKLFYRELVARFSHHQAITWNLGEENNMSEGHGAANDEMSHPNSDEQRKQFSTYIRNIDPNDHMIVVHNSSWDIFPPLYNFAAIEGPSMQVHEPQQAYDKTIQYRNESSAAGKKWIVCVDEIGHYSRGALPDEADPDHDSLRTIVLWGNLMAGGAGVEWYFGYQYPHGDLNCEDWRSRDRLWDQTNYALSFFRNHVDFINMNPNNELLSNKEAWCLADEGHQYVVYLREGGTTKLRLSNNYSYRVQWYNPRTGGQLIDGSIKTITGPGIKSIGNPLSGRDRDWAVLVTKTGE